MRWFFHEETPKRPHLRVNLVLHKCFRSSHRQGCSPHSPLREIDESTSRLNVFASTVPRKEQEAGARPTICLVRRYTVRRRTLCKSEVPGHLETHIPTRLEQRSIPSPLPPRARSSDRRLGTAESASNKPGSSPRDIKMRLLGTPTSI